MRTPEDEFYAKGGRSFSVPPSPPVYDPVKRFLWRVLSNVKIVMWVLGIGVIVWAAVALLGGIVYGLIDTHKFPQDIVWTHILERIGIGNVLVLGCLIILVLIWQKLSVIAKALQALTVPQNQYEERLARANQTPTA